MPEIEFSVYCGVCGSGCCGDTDVKPSRRYGVDVTVTCPICQKRIEELETEVETLEAEIERLKEES